MDLETRLFKRLWRILLHHSELEVAPQGSERQRAEVADAEGPESLVSYPPALFAVADAARFTSGGADKKRCMAECGCEK